MTSDRADYGPKAPPFEVQADGTDLYAVFHGVRIAKRGAKGTPQARTGISLEPGYRVRSNGSIAVSWKELIRIRSPTGMRNGSPMWMGRH